MLSLAPISASGIPAATCGASELGGGSSSSPRIFWACEIPRASSKKFRINRTAFVKGESGLYYKPRGVDVVPKLIPLTGVPEGSVTYHKGIIEKLEENKSYSFKYFMVSSCFLKMKYFFESVLVGEFPEFILPFF